MDGVKLLGDLLHGAIASKSGRRVVQQAHHRNHPLRHGHGGVHVHAGRPGVRIAKNRTASVAGQAVRGQPRGATLGGVLGAAARQHALRRGAHRQIGVGATPHVHYGHAARRRGLNYGGCDDPFAGYGRRDANRYAELLIRAMIAAAKADGRVDPREEARITGELGGRLSPAERQFIQRELARPLDPDDLADDTPRGLQEEVYVASLVAIDLDTNAEARYLRELADELDLSPQHCNALHQQYGERCIF